MKWDSANLDKAVFASWRQPTTIRTEFDTVHTAAVTLNRYTHLHHTRLLQMGTRATGAVPLGPLGLDVGYLNRSDWNHKHLKQLLLSISSSIVNKQFLTVTRTLIKKWHMNDLLNGVLVHHHLMERGTPRESEAWQMRHLRTVRHDLEQLSTADDRAFGAAARRLWNRLPVDVVNWQSLATVKERLKTFLFSHTTDVHRLCHLPLQPSRLMTS